MEDEYSVASPPRSFAAASPFSAGPLRESMLKRSQDTKSESVKRSRYDPESSSDEEESLSLIRDEYDPQATSSTQEPLARSIDFSSSPVSTMRSFDSPAKQARRETQGTPDAPIRRKMAFDDDMTPQRPITDDLTVSSPLGRPIHPSMNVESPPTTERRPRRPVSAVRMPRELFAGPAEEVDYDKMIESPLSQTPDVRILFPRAPDRINRIFVLNVGVPCEANDFTRKYDMVTKVFADNVRRGKSSAAQDEVDRLKIARTFDPKGTISKTSPVYLCKMTNEQADTMEREGVSLGYMPPIDRDRLVALFGERPLVNKWLLETPFCGNSIAYLIESKRLHCATAWNHLVRIMIPFVKSLYELNVKQNMLHNDVTSLNVCYHEAEDKIFLIDFEMLAPRKESQSINRDIVNFFRSVIYDMMPLANAEQQRYLTRVRAIPNEQLTIDRLVTILGNLVKLESVDEEIERMRAQQAEIDQLESKFARQQIEQNQ